MAAGSAYDVVVYLVSSLCVVGHMSLLISRRWAARSSLRTPVVVALMRREILTNGGVRVEVLVVAMIKILTDVRVVSLVGATILSIISGLFATLVLTLPIIAWMLVVWAWRTSAISAAIASLLVAAIRIVSRCLA